MKVTVVRPGIDDDPPSAGAIDEQTLRDQELRGDRCNRACQALPEGNAVAPVRSGNRLAQSAVIIRADSVPGGSDRRVTMNVVPLPAPSSGLSHRHAAADPIDGPEYLVARRQVERGRADAGDGPIVSRLELERGRRVARTAR